MNHGRARDEKVRPGGFAIGRRRADGHAFVPNVSAVSPKSPVHQREVVVTNKLGIHARPSSQFVKLAARHPCDVFLEKDGETINGKSIMGLLMLAAGPGSRLTIVCAGEGAEQALLELVRLVEEKFGEE